MAREIPTQQKFAHPGGLVTNANPDLGSPNGMEFERTAVDSYFARKNEQGWRQEDMASGIEREGPSGPDADSMRDYYQDQQTEASRFMFYPTARGGK